MELPPTDSFKIDVALDGTATLSGISYFDLRDILNAASQYRHHEKPRIEAPSNEQIHQKNLAAARWHLRSQFIIDVLLVKINFEATGPRHRIHGVAEQIEMTYNERAERLESKLREVEKLAQQRGITVVLD